MDDLHRPLTAPKPKNVHSCYGSRKTSRATQDTLASRAPMCAPLGAILGRSPPNRREGTLAEVSEQGRGGHLLWRRAEASRIAFPRTMKYWTPGTWSKTFREESPQPGKTLGPAAIFLPKVASRTSAESGSLMVTRRSFVVPFWAVVQRVRSPPRANMPKTGQQGF